MYIIRREYDRYVCMVHFHKKVDKLMAIGGHIELSETPWQAVAHELEEESGYELEELRIFQPTVDVLDMKNCVVHPTPFVVNTHNVGDEHYHSDLCYGFLAEQLPDNNVAEGESADIRWLTIDELKQATQTGEALPEALSLYRFLINHIDSNALVDTAQFSLEKPVNVTAHYKRGGANESR